MFLVNPSWPKLRIMTKNEIINWTLGTRMVLMTRREQFVNKLEAFLIWIVVARRCQMAAR